jgi:hypothetical protein
LASWRFDDERRLAACFATVAGATRTRRDGYEWRGSMADEQDQQTAESDEEHGATGVDLGSTAKAAALGGAVGAAAGAAFEAGREMLRERSAAGDENDEEEDG